MTHTVRMHNFPREDAHFLFFLFLTFFLNTLEASALPKTPRHYKSSGFHLNIINKRS